jgi:hypothetical protein
MLNNAIIPHSVNVYSRNSHSFVGGLHSRRPLTAMRACHGYTSGHEVAFRDLILDGKLQVRIGSSYRNNMFTAACDSCNPTTRIILIVEIGCNKLLDATNSSGIDLLLQ